MYFFLGLCRILLSLIYLNISLLSLLGCTEKQQFIGGEFFLSVPKNFFWVPEMCSAEVRACM